MLNKTYKKIHNKYSKLFTFIFFLRYLFTIFFISIALFLTIPIFFDYEKKAAIITKKFFENYNYQIREYGKIKFKVFPRPNLEIDNVLINLNNSSIDLKVKKLKIIPQIFSIYNYENFKIDKIVLNDSSVNLKTRDIKIFLTKIFNKDNKFFFKNLNLRLIDKKKILVELKKIKYSNFGYNKNLIFGRIFEKKFKLSVSNPLKNIKFKIYNSGVNADIIFNSNQKKNILSGTFKSKIINTNLMFKFYYSGKKLKVFDSQFRSNNLSFSNETLINLSPFFNISSSIEIEDFNSKILEKINFKQVTKEKNFIKKINNKSEIKYKTKKFSNMLFKEIRLKIDLAYGRLNFNKRLLSSVGNTNCKGSLNLLEEFPLLFFDCLIIINDKKKFLKKLSIKTNQTDTDLNLNIIGNLNILNNKINFSKILMNDSYKASKDDLRYFKETFENTLYDQNFLDIFSLKKIKIFISEIS